MTGDDDHFPYGVFSMDDGETRVGIRRGTSILDGAGTPFPAMASHNLDALMAAGPAVWAAVREWVLENHESLPSRPLNRARMHLPFTVADYVDFYASRQHAEAVGRLFRPDAEPLLPNWTHLPVGYHGRAGTVRVTGTDVKRPSGQLRAGVFGPTAKLDIEAEVAFVVGAPSDGPVSTKKFEEHVFGVCLLNDWSARDIQAWEYVPLGPFLGKSFATSISAWVTPLAALAAARVPQPAADVLPYLQVKGPWGLDLTLEVEWNGEVVSRPPFRTQWWTGPQLLAHLTVNGATTRTGDLLGSGTVSGPDDPGSLLELHQNTRFLGDGDTVTIRATAPAVGGGVLQLGEVTGQICP